MKSAGIAIIVSVIAFAALTSGSALAGGWAVTTFDQLPPEFHAGQPYVLGYTIRQHGQTPIQVDDTRVQITANGTTRELRARIGRRLRPGVVRIAAEHAEGLADRVQVEKADA